MGNTMDVGQLIVELHFVPLSPQESEERRRRLHALLLKGALRLARQNSDQGTEKLAEATVKG
jgi:hypothetical protein